MKYTKLGNNVQKHQNIILANNIVIIKLYKITLYKSVV